MRHELSKYEKLLNEQVSTCHHSSEWILCYVPPTDTSTWAANSFATQNPATLTSGGGPQTGGYNYAIMCNGNTCTQADIGKSFQLTGTHVGVVAKLVSITGAGPCNGLVDFISDQCPADFVDTFFGCMDSTALNYDPLVTMDDGSCTYDVYGCTDSTATNFDPLATIDDGSCIATVFGCTDSTAFNFDPLANTDDGSCIPVLFGCTDPNASNYYASANTDDGSCNYPTVGCTDSTATNYNPNASVDDGSCYWEGCTDTAANNYDPNATVDDGSCTYSTGSCADPTAYPCSSLPPAMQNTISCYEPNHTGCGTPSDPNDTSCCNYTQTIGPNVTVAGTPDCQPPLGGCPQFTMWNPYPQCKCLMVSWQHDTDNELIDADNNVLTTEPFVDCAVDPHENCWVCQGNPLLSGSCTQVNTLPSNWMTQIGIPTGYYFWNSEADCVAAGPDCKKAGIPKKKPVEDKKLREELERIKKLLR